MANGEDLWIFGYGSLIWRPGFAYEECRIATIHGYHRALCVYSHVHRGTPEKPGLVLGLDNGGSCKGVAFRVRAATADAVVAYLREREQVTLVYREIMVGARLDDYRHVPALCYAVDRGHSQYAGRLSRDELEKFVIQGRGLSGANPDYVRNTQDHLEGLGIHDETLEWLSRRLALVAHGQEGDQDLTPSKNSMSSFGAGLGEREAPRLAPAIRGKSVL
jgi:glutathione-specific gamma-glutamylcyclotransferase